MIGPDKDDGSDTILVGRYRSKDRISFDVTDDI